MQGFKTAADRAGANEKKRGGPIRGEGTGTSDSVKTEVPDGSYIMPADSTAEIGPGNVANLGFKPGSVKINASNGEFSMPPEQVHAVGVQALNQMKAATHAPVALAAPASSADMGQDSAAARPELFFADGGLVEDIKKFFPSTAQAVAEYDPVGAYKAGGLPAAAGQTVRAMGTYTGGFLKDAVGRPLATAWDAAANTLKTAATGDSTPIPADQTARGALDGTAQTSVAPAATMTKAAAPAAAPSKPAVPAAQAAASTPSAPATTATPAASPAQANNVTRVGNSYSGKDINGDFTINGQAPGGGMVSAQNNAAAQALSDRYQLQDLARAASGAQGFSAGGPRVGVIADPARAAERNAVFSAATTALKGSPNGQLTANQLRTAQGLLDSEQRDATTRYTANQSAATQQQLAQMNNDAALARTGMTEAGTNSRAAASNQIAQGDLALRATAQGFKTRAEQRQEALYQRYESAKPEERPAIAQQIRDLAGRETPNRFTVVQGGQEIDPTTQQLVTRPARVFNNQSGQFMDQGQTPQQRAPQAGEVRNGYRFKGGNPADQKSWEKV